MIIAKDDEIKRSKIWTIVTSVSSILIIVIAAFFLIKLFMGNPLEGTWAGEDSNLKLTVKSGGSMIVNVPEVQEGSNVEVKMGYAIDKGEKTITIEEDEAAIKKAAEAADGAYTEENLRSAVSSIATTFDYSVDQGQLTLTEREYGEQMVFIKE